MKGLYSSALMAVFSGLLAFSVQAQTCDDCRYISPVFDSVTVSTVYFAQGENIEGDIQDLYMDIYEPYGDTATNRPLVMFAFGGGFVQGSKDDWYVVEVCKHFTRAGYVCAAMDYRIGIDYLEIAVGQHARIFFRPMQDYRAAVQYMKADYSELGNNFRIDTNRIFAGGASAGAITALMMNHCDSVSEMEEMYIAGDPLADLGGFYSTTGFYPNYSWRTMATVNVSGALIDADWIDVGDVPIVSAHGDADDIVPYGSGPFGGITLGVFNLEGSYVVDSIAATKGVCSYLYTMEGKNHPSEDLGLPYIYSVVYRMMLRMYALLDNSSFCCPLQADIMEGDTLYFNENTPPVTLNAEVTGANGSPLVKWCEIPCVNGSDSWSITVQPDTNLEFVTVVAYEGQCSSGDLMVLADSSALVVEPESIEELENKIDVLLYPTPTNGRFTLLANLEDYAGNGLTIEMFSIDGRKVLSKAYRAGTQLKLDVDASGLSQGSYSLMLSSSGDILARKKVVIVR